MENHTRECLAEGKQDNCPVCAPINEAYKSTACQVQEVDEFKVGDGATLIAYSDRRAYTVISISKSGKSMRLQRDKATLINGDEKIFYPGGFVGHTVFPKGQKYSYEADPRGEIIKAFRGKRGWSESGMRGHHRIVPGRSEHYDYNF